MKLDLASGPTPRKGFTGLDLQGPVAITSLWKDIPGVVVNLDLFQMPWPIADNSIEELWCSHFVEHVPDLIGFMDECWRILEPGGIITITHPYQFSVRAWQDPTHVRALNEVSWLYYDQKWRELNGLDHYPIKCDFASQSSEFVANDDWVKATGGDLLELHKAARNYNNVIDDLVVVLRAVK